MTTVIWLTQETSEHNPFRKDLMNEMSAFGERMRNDHLRDVISFAMEQLMMSPTTIQFALKHGYRYAIAVDRSVIQGVTCIRPKGFGSNRLISHFIVVDPKYERKRIATQLHERVVDFAHHEGFTKIEDMLVTPSGRGLIHKWIQNGSTRMRRRGKKLSYAAERHELKGELLLTHVLQRPRPFPRNISRAVRQFLRRFRLNR